MAILGNNWTMARMLSLMQIYSTLIHKLNYDLSSLLKKLNQLTDQQIQDIFQAGGSSDPAADVTAFRSWQGAVSNLVTNYTGTGTLSDNSFEISKRYDPTI